MARHSDSGGARESENEAATSEARRGHEYVLTGNWREKGPGVAVEESAEETYLNPESRPTGMSRKGAPTSTLTCLALDVHCARPRPGAHAVARCLEAEAKTNHAGRRRGRGGENEGGGENMRLDPRMGGTAATSPSLSAYLPHSPSRAQSGTGIVGAPAFLHLHLQRYTEMRECAVYISISTSFSTSIPVDHLRALVRLHLHSHSIPNSNSDSSYVEMRAANTPPLLS
ncbi:hypothetical protein B0H13DRAFT_2356191 [Mycena leptocephala]|nr:hypothetical protein B0H13DRAFT_2356191 [Mycena leptocephala]